MTELTPEERTNIAAAKYTILHEGHLLPVTNMFDNHGDDVDSPMRAFRCVAYWADAPGDEGKWYAIQCKPGEIAPKRGESK